MPSVTLDVLVAGPPTAQPGNSITYTVAVGNEDPVNPAQNVTLTDQLPLGATYLSSGQAGGPTFQLSQSGGQVTGTLATLPPLTWAFYTVTALPPGNLPAVDQASATTSTQLSGASTTSASATTSLGPAGGGSADLTVTAVASANPQDGQQVTYALTVTNAGSAPAPGVILTDYVPAVTTFVSQTQVSGPTFTLGNSGNQVNDSIANLSSGASATIDVTAQVGSTVLPGTALPDLAAAVSGTSDPSFGNNSATALTTVAPTLSWTGPGFTWSQSQSPPVVTNPGNQTNAEGDTVSLQIAATDPNHAALSYDAVNLPAGLTINATTGQISGSVGYQAAEDFSGSYPVTVFVTDAQSAGAEVSFTWTVNDTPRPPVVTPVGNQSNAAGDTVSVQVSATQPDGDPLSYDATGLPSGLSIDAGTGLISGTIDPSAGSATPYAVTVTVTDSTPATPQTAGTTFTWAVGAAAPAPALDNPGDQVNAAGDSVDVSLTGSDGGGYALTYTASGLPAGLAIDPGSGAITGTVAASAVSATPYNVTATASDGQASASQSFHWTVVGVSFTSPGDQQNVDGAAVSLPIAASDVANHSLTFSASGLPAGLSINSSTGVISGTVGSSADASSPHSVTVTATDGTTSGTTSFSWEVDRLALAGPSDQQNLEGDTVSLQLSATDLLGTPTFSATGLPAGLSINASNGLISGTIGRAAHGLSPYQVTVTATDGAASTSQSFVWTVTPQVVIISPGPQQSAAGDSVSLAVSASDRANHALTYSASGLPSGLGINATTGVISGTVAAGAVSSTPYSVMVTASDGTYSSSQTFSWSVATISLAAPGDQSNLDDDVVSLALAAHYHGTGTLSYSATGLPGGLSINTGTGLISGTLAGSADAGAPYAVTVTATDGTASASQSFTWNIAARVTLSAISAQANVQGDTVSLAVSATDAAAGAVLTYGASGLPAGLSINSTTGVISGLLTASVGSGPYAVTVTAADGTATVSQTFNWSVVPVVLTNPGDQITAGGAAVSLALTADVQGGYYSATFSASGLPAGLSIGSSTGIISGTPAAGDVGQSYLVTVTAASAGGTSSQTFTWRVGAVVVQAPASQTNTEGNSVSLAVSAAAASGTLSYSATGLPAGLSINATTGVISGTIAAGAAVAGPYTVTVVASNGSAAEGQTFTWTVNPRVVVNPIADQTNQEGDNVSLQVTASEPGATLSYSATGLPDGLTINSGTGLISGTVAAGASADGPFAADVTVTDGTYSTDVVFSWTIASTDHSAPVLTSPGIQVNVVGDSVSLAVSASDADGDALFYSADGLPDGLEIDPDTGIISGTVADDAISSTPSTVTLSVEDGNGNSATGTFLWVINDSALTVQAGTITAPEGIDTGEITVASFTDTNPNWAATDFTATIAWGDGTTDTGEVASPGGRFTVSGSHVYDDPGAYTPQVTVTDGFTTVTTNGTATVSPAALTVTGVVQQGAVAGSAVSGDWVSFTDADPTDAAGSYTATINWGDNSAPTTGTVTGVDGDFVVSGSHAYTAAGAYTVTVTVVNPEGASGTATSTAEVGNVYAGVAANLTVASFTSNDPNATAGQFTATVNWGDGSAPSAATVTGGNGSFTVQGSHTYAVDSLDLPGGTYPVTVTVQGPSGNTLTATQGVHVERPPVAGTADNVVAQPGAALSNVEVATFTEPDLSDGTGEFSATITWGDGTTTPGTVTWANGAYHVLGGHTYATIGDFPVAVAVSQAWNYSAVTAIMVGVVEVAPAAAPFIQGPSVVPGNSTYGYQLILPAGVATVKKRDWASSDTTAANIVKDDTDGTGWRTTEDGWKTTASLFDHFNFKNKAAEVTISVTYDIGDGVQTAKLVVDVVQVTVKTPRIAPFEKGQVQDAGNQDGDGVDAVIDNVTAANTIKNVSSGSGTFGAADAKGLVAAAEITLKGAGADGKKGVDKITVGFVQHVEWQTYEVQFPTAKKKLVKDLASTPTKKQVFLDGAGGATAWYDTQKTHITKGKSGTISFDDTPTVAIPLKLGADKAAKLEAVWSFTLDVAATTSDVPNTYWQEATAPWSVNFSGKITFNAAATDVNKQYTWTSDGAAIKVPDKWTITDAPAEENTKGPTINDASMKNRNWTSVPLK